MMNEIETIKFYLIYYKKDKNSLYAWTLEKDKVNRFLEERCKDCFIVIKKKLNTTLSAVFMNENCNLKLCEIPLYDGEKYITLMGTNTEENQMQDAADNLFFSMNAIRVFLNKYPFKEKYDKVIKTLTKITIKDSTGEEYMQINLFDLFIHVHQNTFQFDSINYTN